MQKFVADSSFLFFVFLSLCQCFPDFLIFVFLDLQIIASENQPVRWTTPLGLPVVQPYRKFGRHLVSITNSAKSTRVVNIRIVFIVTKCLNQSLTHG